MGAVFNLETITITSVTNAVTTGNLLPLAQQAAKMNGGIFNDAYGTVFSNITKNPPFTLDELTVVPFGFAHKTSQNTNDGTLHTETDAYQTNLHCSSAQEVSASDASRQGQCDGSAYLASGTGCRVRRPRAFSASDSHDLTAGVSYSSWYGSVMGDSFDGQGCSCPQNFSNTFLATVWLNDSTTTDESYFFCRTEYEKFRVNATVSLSDNTLLDWHLLTPPEPISPREFNTSRFDLLLGLGVWITFFPNLAFSRDVVTGDSDVDGAFGVESITRDLAWVRQNVVYGEDLSQYAFYLDKRPMAVFSDLEQFQGALQATHRLFFNLAIRATMVESNVSDTSRYASHARTSGAVVVSKTFVIIAQCCLGIAAAAAFLCLALYRTRASGLTTDPSSILAVADLIGPTLPALLISEPGETDRHRRIRLNNRTFALSRTLTSASAIEVQDGPRPVRSASSIEKSSAKLVQPLETRTAVIVMFALTIVTIITGLCVLQVRMRQNHGLVLATDSVFVRNLFLSYVPTLLGTLLEGTWVLINRAFCVLAPFEGLTRGRTSAQNTLAARYTNLPPQLNLIRALRGRQITLASVCMVATVANVVSVALSGLFITLPTTLSTPHAYKIQAQPNLVAGQRKLDYIVPIERNLTNDEHLPAWTTPSHYFLPLHWSPERNASTPSGNLRARAIGIGLDPKCQAGHDVSFDLGDQTSTLPQVHITVTQEVNGKNARCTGTSDQVPAFYSNGITGSDYQDVLHAARHTAISQEASSVVLPDGHYGEAFPADGSCDNLYAVSWFRAGVKDGENVRANSSLPNLEAKFVVCNPIIEAVEFDVLVSPQGLIIDVDQNTAKKRQDAKPFINTTMVANVPSNPIAGPFDAFRWTTGTAVGYWHNGTVALDWLNYMIMLKTDSYAHVDPKLPSPDPNVMAPMVSDIIKRLFAVTLGKSSHALNTPVPLSNESFSGSIEWTEDRIFFAPYMFEITTSLLAFNLIIALVVLVMKPGRSLPTMPTTIAAIAVYISGSSIHDDLLDGRATPESLAKSDTQFSFGKYIGTDGLPHLGIDRDQYVRLVERTDSMGRLRKRLG